MDRPQPLLEGGRPHGGGAHHMGARLQIVRRRTGPRQIGHHQTHPFQRDAL